MPFLLSIISFTCIYLVVPYCKIKFKHALIGALVAALLFEIAKYIFVFYVANFHTYEVIYSSMAIFPIFLMWLYLSWLIVLLGAELVHTLSSFKYKKYKQKDYSFLQAFRLLGHLWQAQKIGISLSLKQLVLLEQNCLLNDPEEVLLVLIDKKIIKKTESKEFILTRNLNDMSFYEFCELMPWKIPKKQDVIVKHKTKNIDKFKAWNTNLEESLSVAHSSMKSSLDKKLCDYYQ